MIKNVKSFLCLKKTDNNAFSIDFFSCEVFPEFLEIRHIEKGGAADTSRVCRRMRRYYVP